MKSKPQPPATPVKASDPLDINQRLYRQLGKLLDDMEGMDRDDTMTFPQRVSALIAVGRVQKMFADLRKADFNVGAGSEVRKYAAAFAPANAARGGKAASRPVIELVELDGSDSDDGDDDFGDDAA